MYQTKELSRVVVDLLRQIKDISKVVGPVLLVCETLKRKEFITDQDITETRLIFAKKAKQLAEEKVKEENAAQQTEVKTGSGNEDSESHHNDAPVEGVVCEGDAREPLPVRDS